MKVSYFPGCTLKNKAKDLDLYAYKAAEALGVTLEEIENWQCCGGVFTTANDEVATKLSSVRLLKDAAASEQPLVTVCSACHNVIKQTNHAMQTNSAFADKVNRYTLGDIDVRIMLPEKSDTRIAHYSTMSYIAELLEAGVKVYLFKKGFNHSKVVSVDGEVSIVGSANMDMRSFEHNFEIMQVIYDKGCASVIEKQFLKDAAACTQMTSSKWAKRGKKEKIAESVARLCSPLL